MCLREKTRQDLSAFPGHGIPHPASAPRTLSLNLEREKSYVVNDVIIVHGVEAPV